MRIPYTQQVLFPVGGKDYQSLSPHLSSPFPTKNKPVKIQLADDQLGIPFTFFGDHRHMKIRWLGPVMRLDRLSKSSPSQVIQRLYKLTLRQNWSRDWLKAETTRNYQKSIESWIFHDFPMNQWIDVYRTNLGICETYGNTTNKEWVTYT